MKKNKNSTGGLVYSTEANFDGFTSEHEEEQETLLADKQMLRVLLDKKNRGGKIVTLITGFVGSVTDLENLGKALKNQCGSGGSAKDGEIIVQGDHRDKVLAYLIGKGYTKARKIG